MSAIEIMVIAGPVLAALFAIAVAGVAMWLNERALRRKLSLRPGE